MWALFVFPVRAGTQHTRTRPRAPVKHRHKRKPPLAFIERADLRQSHNLTFEDDVTGQKRWVGKLRPLHYHDGSQWQRVDLTPQRVLNATADGWQVLANGFRYFLGMDIANHGVEDGWFGFGTQDNQHWVKSRLRHAGYLDTAGTPTLANHFTHVDNVNRAPTWNRLNLSQTVSSSEIEGVTINEVVNVTWADLWPALPQGQVNLEFNADGRWLKSNIRITQAAREWIAANRPGTGYFGLVLQMDWSTVPKIVLRSIQKATTEHYDDSDLSPGEYMALRDAADGLIAGLPIDYMWSSGDPTQRIRLRKRYWQDADGNTYLAIGAPVSQIQALPAGDLIFDPTYDQQPGATGVDALLVQNDATTNYGNYLGFETGRDGANTARRSLTLWDLSSIPADATCDDATLTLYNHTSSNNSTNAHTIYHMLQAWTETGCTWNTYDGTNSWPGGAGADGDKGNSIGTFAPLGASTPGFVAITLSPTEVETKFNTNLDMFFREDAEQAFRKAGWYSSDHSTASQRPQLVINYTEAGAGGADLERGVMRGVGRGIGRGI